MEGKYHDLLRFREVVSGIGVELHLSKRENGHKFFGDELRGIQEVETKCQSIRLVDNLNTKLPFRSWTAWSVRKLRLKYSEKVKVFQGF